MFESIRLILLSVLTGAGIGILFIVNDQATLIISGVVLVVVALIMVAYDAIRD